MTEQHKPRYVTRAINGELNIEIQVLLWELLDSIAVSRKDKMDYLQVFEIVNSGNKLKITNRQEQPAMKKELIIESTLEIKDTTVWIINEPNYQTMLFPSDY
ncbi:MULTISPECIES: DUF960 family protein [Bacillaceae]|jgi:hypothetical protein|uniref:DUF960 family protein n=1 Tax=Bacillaceae TaxID=186817 RepID=UPI001CCC6E6E|nr:MULTISPECIES: DUF960 family protein [Bacillus]MCU4961686.1 DUF960 domain-containing protein [Bacillus paranthracis]MCU5166137.1 DUF960 domain-containing protein [Bacillus paranthracis]MDX5925988.1 DUF960 family protein [Bacillus cereus group sp. BfR-BA-00967]UBM45845.1 DUF960 domain-containing protein [Bacillus velezensis]HEF5700870.1 hypothetical protein [Bacillus paranthracis]